MLMGSPVNFGVSSLFLVMASFINSAARLGVLPGALLVFLILAFKALLAYMAGCMTVSPKASWLLRFPPIPRWLPVSLFSSALAISCASFESGLIWTASGQGRVSLKGIEVKGIVVVSVESWRLFRFPSWLLKLDLSSLLIANVCSDWFS